MTLFPFPDNDPRRAARRPLLLFVLIALGVGALASPFADVARQGWYANLPRPDFAPPGWLFPPVWTGMYLLMGWAGWRVWRRSGTRSPEMTLYGMQLLLTPACEALLFGLHRPGPGLAAAAFLALARAGTAGLFFRRDRLAGSAFLIPLGWALYEAVTFAVLWRPAA